MPLNPNLKQIKGDRESLVAPIWVWGQTCITTTAEACPTCVGGPSGHCRLPDLHRRPIGAPPLLATTASIGPDQREKDRARERAGFWVGPGSAATTCASRHQRLCRTDQTRERDWARERFGERVRGSLGWEDEKERGSDREIEQAAKQVLWVGIWEYERFTFIFGPCSCHFCILELIIMDL